MKRENKKKKETKHRDGTMTVEYYRLWPDHTWDTDFIKIPGMNSNLDLNTQINNAVCDMRWEKGGPVAVGLYCADAGEEE